MQSRSVRFILAAPLAMLLVLAIGTGRAAGQATTGGITGTVTDSSGALVPNAAVQITNTGTSQTQSVTSNAQGRYIAPDLPIGTYSVQASAPGFQTVVHNGIVLTVGGQTTVDFLLAVGQAQQTVTVAGQAAQVETSNAVDNLVEPTQMTQLPLNGRDFLQLMTLAPGVQTMPAVGAFYGTQANYSVAGSRPEGQLFLLDDTNINNFWNNSTGSGATGSTLGIEAIDQFQTLINTYSTQFGGNGIVVNAASKSGTNSFHGSAYEFFRNRVLDARNYFDPPNQLPAFRRNQFGASLGGPIKRDKAFFFFNYEGVRQLLGISTPVTVPDANAHKGLLPVACGAAGQPPCGSGGLANVGVNPAIASLLAVFPIPSVEGTGGFGHYTAVTNQAANENYYLGRVDYNFSDKDSIFVRFVDDRGSLLIPSVIPIWPQTNVTANDYVTFEEKHIFSSNVINLARFSYVRPTENDFDTGGVPALQYYSYPGAPQGAISIAGLNAGTVGYSAILPFHAYLNRFSEGDDVIWTHGAHNVTLGGSITRVQDNTLGPYNQGGTWAFFSLQNFLQAQPGQFSGTLPTQHDAQRDVRELWFSIYINDQWQATRKLTVNAGLRYDPTTNMTETANKFHALPDVPFGTSFVPVPHAFATNPSLLNFGPRAGIAYDPYADHKTIFRAGFGVFEDIIQARTIMPNYWLTTPFTTTVLSNPTYPDPFVGSGASAPVSTGQGVCYCVSKTPYMMQYNFNMQRDMGADFLLTLGYVGSVGRDLLGINDLNPPTLAPGTTIQNPVFAKLVNGRIVTNPRINPIFASLDTDTSFGRSNYNSLQASLNHRMVHSLQTQISYTWSKAMDNTSGTTNLEFGGSSNQNPQNPYLPNLEYARSAYDRTQALRASAVLALPYQRNQFVAGWQLSGIWNLVTGSPFTAATGFDQMGLATTAGFPDRPNLVPGCSSSPLLRKVNEWFNTSCFSLPPVGVPGTLRRNTIIGPPTDNFDFAILKDTAISKISDQMHAQFRAEFFDLLNHPNFSLPISGVFSEAPADAGTIVSPVAGHIVSTTGNAATGGSQRVIQLALKILF